MNQAYTFLVLTDHRAHKARNPIYSLLPELLLHPACASIHIASRGNPANDTFFLQQQSTTLEVLPIGSDLTMKIVAHNFFLQDRAMISTPMIVSSCD